jgi:phosphoribosylformimino-5-aminoimidazole carboxamide ribotide isomerase
MEVIPALDLVGEDAVRLYQGDFARPIWRRPAVDHLDTLVRAGAGRLHIVDLDGARTGVVRVELLGRLLRRAGMMRVQVAGGIRSPAVARTVIDAGADRVIIGTAAFADRDALQKFVDDIGSRLVVAIDVRGGYVTVRGWQTETALVVEEAVQRCCDARVARLLCTAVDRDGTLAGPDLELLRTVASAGIPVMAAGGVRSQQDVDDLAAIGCEAAIVGTALVSNSEALLT